MQFSWILFVKQIFNECGFPNIWETELFESFKNNEKRKGDRFSFCLPPFAQSKYSEIQLLYEIQDFILSYILIITLYILPLIFKRKPIRISPKLFNYR
jgi:hypothetical protein